MNREDRIQYAQYRLESAYKTMDAARLLAEGQFWNSAVNRLYYAAFYAVNAILVLHEIPCKSHSATKTQFSMHFIKTGKLDKKFGKLFAELFDWRQKGDYSNIKEFTGEEVLPLFEPLKEMLDTIEKSISESLK